MQTLLYIHDPMCSWCWGFRPTWQVIKDALMQDKAVNIRYILGGLASDSDELMPLSTQQYVQDNWKRIQQVIPNTEFNYDFWAQCQPRRSTYPACRAVIAAKYQSLDYEEPMILSIQQAYYMQAQNPSDHNILMNCANSVGLDIAEWVTFVKSDACEQLLQRDIQQYHQLAQQTIVSGFPSLALENPITGKAIAVPIDYNNPNISVDFIRSEYSP